MDMNSKKAFNDRIKFEEEGNYKEALESYNFVNENDNDNYEESRKHINSIKEVLKNEEILSVYEAKLVTTATASMDIYPNQIQVILKNNDSRNIVKFEITIFAYDENNNPVKIKDKGLETEDYLFLGVADNINIHPADTWGYEYGWSIFNDNIDRIEACVEYAQYDDGTNWDNPLYLQWLKDHWVDE